MLLGDWFVLDWSSSSSADLSDDGTIHCHFRRLQFSTGLASALSAFCTDCLSPVELFVSTQIPESRLSLRFRFGGDEHGDTVTSDFALRVEGSSLELEPSSSDEEISECFAIYWLFWITSSRFRLNTTFLGCGKKAFLLESLGLALTDEALRGSGEFFKIDRTPNGNDRLYGWRSCCVCVCVWVRESWAGFGDSVLGTGDGRYDKSQVLARVFVVVGVYVAC